MTPKGIGLQQVYPTAVGTPGESDSAIVDIIAVHGINGHRQDTFTSGGHFWLKDSLPNWIPRSRVFTYGYNSDVFFSDSASYLSDWSQSLLRALRAQRKEAPERPIIFICHSLGGIVVKQALIEAKLDPAYYAIGKSASAIVFLATPHGGSGLKNYANVLEAIANIGATARDEPLKLLKEKSPRLQDLTQQFRHQCGGLEIVSFFEQIPTNGELLVDKHSAMLNLPLERQVSVEVKHADICRFKKEDEEYGDGIAGMLREELVCIFDKVAGQAESKRNKKLELYLLGAIMPGNTPTILSKAPQPHAGTCSWIFEHPVYDAWKNDNSNCLLIQGGPGCGKSVLLLFLIESLKKKFGLVGETPLKSPTFQENPMDRAPITSPKMIVASYFCGDVDENRRTDIWILRSLIHQACTQNPNLLKHVRSWYQSEEYNAQPGTATPDATNPEDVFGSYKVLREILIAITADPEVEGIYFIIERLDCCGQSAAKFLRLIREGRAAGHSKIRYIVSSRPSNFIQRTLRTTHSIELNKENQNDISIVVTEKMKSLQDYHDFPDSLRYKVQNLLVERSDGMFLWVDLALGRLVNYTGIWDESIIEKTLQEIPSSLNDVYNEILEKAGGNSNETIPRLRKLLMWLYFAGRDLKLDELHLILSLKPDEKFESKVEMLFKEPEEFQKYISNLCGAILVVQNDGTVKLAHQSIKDFLHGLYNMEGNPSKFAITVKEAHAEMAGVCINYLSLKEIRTKKVPDLPVDANGQIDTIERKKVIREYLHEHVLLEYSVLYLGDHLRALEGCSNIIKLYKFEDFFQDGSVPLLNWVNAYDLIKVWTHGKYPGRPDGANFLSVATRLNLMWLAEESLRDSGWVGETIISKVNIPDFSGWLPIHMATHSESVDVVEWLLKNGSAVNVSVVGLASLGITPLHIAASKKTDIGAKMVEILLANKANPNALTRLSKNSPLHYAIDGGLIEIVKALLDAGSTIDPANRIGWTPLHKACSLPGLHKIVSTLLDKDADVEGKMSVGTVAAYREVTTASNLYSIKGMISTARNIAGTITPLHTAAMTAGTEETLRVLLENGASCSATDGQGHTALHLVARGVNGIDSERKAVLLLNAKASVNARDSRNQTPLHKAVSPPARVAVLKVLLSSPECEIDARDKKGRTPLLLFLQVVSTASVMSAGEKRAAPSYNLTLLETVLDLLLGANANTDIVDSAGKSALQYAREADLAWATAKIEKFTGKSPTTVSPTEKVRPVQGGISSITSYLPFGGNSPTPVADSPAEEVRLVQGGISSITSYLPFGGNSPTPVVDSPAEEVRPTEGILSSVSSRLPFGAKSLSPLGSPTSANGKKKNRLSFF